MVAHQKAGVTEKLIISALASKSASDALAYILLAPSQVANEFPRSGAAVADVAAADRLIQSAIQLLRSLQRDSPLPEQTAFELSRARDLLWRARALP